jgi:hypothetical protein
MSTRKVVTEYRAYVRWLKARIRRDQKRLEIEPLYRKCEYLQARIVCDSVAVDDFESRIYWLTQPPEDS